MSLPETAEEREQYDAAEAVAGPAENVVSTACPVCGVRFALLARYKYDGWHLRCVPCGYQTKGELK